MDKTDMSLILLLLQNSRSSYAELADKLSLSVNAVHKRIQQLIEADVIHRFIARVSLLSSQGLTVYVSGTSQLEITKDLPDKLCLNGSIFWLALSSAKYIYTGAYIRNISELEPLISYVKKEASISEPTVGILQPFQATSGIKPADLELCKLDYRIINALKDDSRRNLADVATELGVSAKTVRRRLDRMTKNDLIELTLEWYPDKSDDIITLMDVKLKPDSKRIDSWIPNPKSFCRTRLVLLGFCQPSQCFNIRSLDQQHERTLQGSVKALKKNPQLPLQCHMFFA